MLSIFCAKQQVFTIVSRDQVLVVGLKNSAIFREPVSVTGRAAARRPNFPCISGASGLNSASGRIKKNIQVCRTSESTFKFVDYSENLRVMSLQATLRALHKQPMAPIGNHTLWVRNFSTSWRKKD